MPGASSQPPIEVKSLLRTGGSHLREPDKISCIHPIVQSIINMKKIAVIGGGPGGLVTLKYLTEAHTFLPVEPVHVRLFEADDDVGGTFYQRTYEDGEVGNKQLPLVYPLPSHAHSPITQQVSSKYLTTFSDFRPLASDPDFLPMKRYLEYLDEYCSHFDLWKYIELNTRVTRLRRKGRGHVVTFKKQGQEQESWECDSVAICTGLHVEPHIPHVEGIEHVPVVIHSSKFKGKTDFGEDKNIVVLGVGETGMDIAHLAVTSPNPQSVTICHRRGFLGGPKIRNYALFALSVWY